MRLGMDMVERHERSVEHMIEAVESFCTAIDEERLPDDIALTVPQVNDLYPKAEGEVELDHSSLMLIDEWNAIKEAMKDLDSKEKRVKDALANLLRDSEFGSVNGQRVLSFKSQSAKRFDSKALVAAHPELETQFTTQSSFRVLRVVK
jgi:predicted phage-related endonuclease